MEGIDLDLVDGRGNFVERDQVHQPVRREIGDADSAQLAGLVRVLHRAPGTVDVAEGLVDQVQVEVIHLQALQRLVDCLRRLVVAGVLHPQLAGDEQVAARDAAILDAGADRRFVLVRRGRIDQAVAGANGVDDGAGAFSRVGDLENTEAEYRHDEAVVECNVFHVVAFE